MMTRMICGPHTFKGQKIQSTWNFDLKLRIFYCPHRGTLGEILRKIWDSAYQCWEKPSFFSKKQPTWS